MGQDKRTPEEILEAEIKTAKQEVLNSVNINNGPTGAKDPDDIPKDRTTNRLMKKQLDQLDFLVEKFLRFRGELTDPDGHEADEKLVYYNRIWHKQCDNFNRKPRANFKLRHEAYMDRVEYFLDLEKQQIKAAATAYKKNQFDKFVRLHHHEFKWRILRYKVKAFFMRKKGWKDLLCDWWNLEKIPVVNTYGGKTREDVGYKPEHSPLST